MKTVAKHFLFLLAVLSGLVSATTHIAILETVLEGKEDPSSPFERRDITRKIIEAAKGKFRDSSFVIMDRENIEQMLPPGRTLEDCESDCLVDVGRNISAEYVFQARMSTVLEGIGLVGELRGSSKGNFWKFQKAVKREDVGQQAVFEAKALFDSLLVYLDVPQAGISGLSMGSDKSLFTVNVTGLKPLEIGFSVDGATMPECDKTPCSVRLTTGLHRFYFHAPKYRDLDTSITVKGSDISLDITLKPNFGTLVLNPRIVEGIGNESDFEMFVDNDRFKSGSAPIELMPGNHKVVIRNPCYEPAEFSVNMERGFEVKFDSILNPLTGRLNLTAKKDGRLVKIPVFIGNERMEFTPFNKEIPICADITVGRDHDTLNVALKAGERVVHEYSYSGLSAQLESDYLDKRDGMAYPVVKVGSQDWMVRNLAFKKKNKSWCYSGDSANCKKYGMLYKWEDASKVCPTGWTLPSAADFDSLFMFIGDKAYAGSMLKSSEGWDSNGNGSDEFAFSALPAGYRNQNDSYYGLGQSAFFWTSDQVDGSKAKKVTLDNLNGASISEDYKDAAFSVRCIRDKNYVDVDTLCENLTWTERGYWNVVERKCSESTGSSIALCRDKKAKCLKEKYFPRFWKEFLKNNCDERAEWNKGCYEYNVATKAIASKTLDSQGDNFYTAQNILNDDLTVWAAKFEKKPIRIDLYVKPGATVYGMAVRNGYWKDPDSYRNNSRMRKVNIYAGKKKLKTVEFEDWNYAYDMINFDKPLSGIEKITVEIVDVHRGDKWNDVCVTGMVLIGTPASQTENK